MTDIIDTTDSCLRYTILDPTGNITALVETPVPVEKQPGIAAEIMKRHPKVEQVGFVQYHSDAQTDVSLRMAGGEFCGNASMCAAALAKIRNKLKTDAADAAPVSVLLTVSGAAEPVEVRLSEANLTEERVRSVSDREANRSFLSSIHMPPARGIENRIFSFEGSTGSLPVVFMEGISHIVIEPSSPLFQLKNNPEDAEAAVRSWCEDLSADGLGMMFLEPADAELTLTVTPLVYVPGSGTSFWENSCASGSTAVGMYLAMKKNGPVKVKLTEPGGILQVKSDPHGETWLYGHVTWQEDHSIHKPSL